MPDPLLSSLCILVAAALYSSVGHGGASAYLAVMSLLGVSAAVMKPAALLLNVLVAGIATVRFYRARSFSWRLFWPFALTSVPCAALGGAMRLSPSTYAGIVGIVLFATAMRLA